MPRHKTQHDPEKRNDTNYLGVDVLNLVLVTSINGKRIGDVVT